MLWFTMQEFINELQVNSFYIGQTGCDFEVTQQEHFRPTRGSIFASHILQSNHAFSSIELLNIMEEG